jgi:hypothetical protein
MLAYLVRTIDEHDIVGFFFADEMDDFLIAADECTGPADCEYAELPAGGILRAAGTQSAGTQSEALFQECLKLLSSRDAQQDLRL